MTIPRQAPGVPAPAQVPLYPRATSEHAARYQAPSVGLLAVPCNECRAAEGMTCEPRCPAARSYVANLHGLLRALVSGPCLICAAAEGQWCREQLGFAGTVGPIDDFGTMAPALYLETVDRLGYDHGGE